MAHEQNFLLISAAQKTAKEVRVTPAVAPTAGQADLEAIGRNFPKGRKVMKSTSIDAAEFVMPLPGWAREGDCIFWTTYS